MNGAFRRAIGCALSLTIGTFGALPARATSLCNPFGNAPAGNVSAVMPSCFGGKMLTATDSDGTARYACVYAPAMPPAYKLPLVIFFHGSEFNADSTVEATNLPEYVSTANLSDDTSKPGFILLAIEGRNTHHFYPSPDDQAPGWDNWYRQLNPNGDVTVGGVTYKENVDAAITDRFAAQIADVDADRVYVSGWSNGAAMAYLYGLMRPAGGTLLPSGIAAIGVYSSPNPFGAFNDPCEQIPVTSVPTDNNHIRIFNAGVPSFHVHNDCDIAGICPNGELMESELLPIGIGVQDTIINSAMQPTNGCLSACGTDPQGAFTPQESPGGWVLGTTNHVRWPMTSTPAMLDFFRRHPMSSRPH